MEKAHLGELQAASDQERLSLRITFSLSPRPVQKLWIATKEVFHSSMLLHHKPFMFQDAE
jgi:hypothetical protein